MTRIAALALLVLAAASPAMSERTPAGMMDRAQFQVRELDRELNQVRHPELRRQLEDRVDRIARILDRIESTGALEARYGPPGRFEHRGPPVRGISFDDAMRSVRAETFDSRKLEVIVMVSRSGRFTTEQARALAAQLTFDSKKADALIALYPSVVDPQRYMLALDVLDFGSSRRRVAQTLRI